jgi:amino acid adenylation domain-containing protein
MGTPTNEISSFRLAPQQHRLLASSRPGSVTQALIGLEEQLDEAGLQQALQALVARHEILRTTFALPEGMRVRQQAIHGDLPAVVTGAAPPDAAALERLRADEASSIDFEQGPVLRAVLVKLPDGGDGLLLTASAATLDRESVDFLLAELGRAREGVTEAGDPLQYADYAEWRNGLLTGEEVPQASRAFWSEDARPPTPTLLLGRSSGGDPAALRAVPLVLDGPFVAAVRAAAALSRVGEDCFLEACWHALVARLSGEAELTLAGREHGRTQPDLDGAIGPYAQVVPIRSRFDDNTTFAEILDQVSRSRAEAARWQDYASAADLAAFGAQARIGFSYLRTQAHGPLVGRDLAVSPARDSTLELELALHATGDTLGCTLVFDPSRYDSVDVEEIAEAFVTLVTGAAREPATAVATLAVLSDPARERVLALGIGPEAELAATPIHRLFEERAAATPDRPGVAGNGEHLSLAELNAAANRLAHRLRELGVGRNDRVAHCLDRSPAAIVALLGILKAGGAYVPLNHEHPPARLGHQLTEAGVTAIVTQEPLLGRLPSFAGPIVCVDRDADALSAYPSVDPDAVNEPDDLVYVIYTSGSTGLPKGVAVTHRNLANYTAFMVKQLRAEDGLHFGLVSALSTDLGNTSVFPALATGGCVHLISPATAMNVDSFAAYVAEQPIDVLKITPSHLAALVSDDAGAAVLPRRWLVCGGEALTSGLVTRLRSLSPRCGILNHYGPTETTVGSCVLELSAPSHDGEGLDGGPTPGGTVPIGRPIANTSTYVLDRLGEPVPVGVVGELCIGGAGVARGYINRPDETAERFVDDAFAGVPGARMYRTGDRARYLRDGSIEFHGRVDHQTKIRGFRVEPGEVEATLQRHPDVRQAAVVAHGERDDLRLVAYLVASPQPAVAELRSFLTEWLPEYMIPSLVVPMDTLPLNPSGKVDRQALPDPALVELQREEEFIPPRNTVEEEIAEIWKELLGVDRVSVRDDFFALGGHSLLATQMITRIRKRHGDIPLQALFAAPTVAALADVVQGVGTR